MNEQVLQKLKVLAESAKYDVSCASSGTVRRNSKGGVGNTVGGWGICHSFAEDGRCISLLKIMLTNYCIYDCAYCINRISNDIPRATLSVSELVDLTMEFYRRNYIEGLFLSSGVVRNPDYTMERLVRVAKDLREVHRFNGYIHLKSIPGASEELVRQAGLYADRLSVNLEIPTEENLKRLAPEITVIGKACPLFVPLVEEGWYHDPVTEEVARRYLKELQDQEIDTLILGCTHYPLLRSTIRKIMGEDVRLVNPAYETALELKKLLADLDLASDEAAQEEFPYRFYVSDLAEKFKDFANSILSYNVEKTQKIDIEKY